MLKWLKEQRLVPLAAVVVAIAIGLGILAKLGKLPMNNGSERDMARTQEPPAATPPTAPETVPDTIDGGPSPEAASWTMDDLNPSIQAVGEEGTVPSAFRIVFAKPVGAPAAPAGNGTVVALEPEVPGKLRYESASTLLFTPDAPLDFEQSYKVSLEALGVGEHVVNAKAKDAVSRVFQTPAFGLKRMALRFVDEKRFNTEFDLVFTGPVPASQVGGFAGWRAISPLSKVDYRTGSAANEVIGIIPTASLGLSRTVTFTLKPGLKAADGKSFAPARTVETALFGGKEVQIKQVRLKEGANGFYVQIVCNDLTRVSADEHDYKNRIYVYDRDAGNGIYVSDRCQPDEDTALSRINFKPKTKVRVVPSRGGFRILGDFAAGELSLTIDPGITTVDGGIVKAPVVETFSVPHRRPTVGFAARGRFLPRDSWKSLGLRHQNVDAAELSIRVIPPENLVFWMSADNETADDRNSNLVLNKTLKLRGKLDAQTTTYADLGAILPTPPKGVMELVVTELPTKKSVDKKRLIVTDINLVAKRAQSGAAVHVWALAMKDGSPMAGVAVKEIVRSGRSVADCVTNGQGFCALAYDKTKQIDASEPFALIAQKETDLTYMKFSELKTEVSEQLVAGRPFSGGASPYRAAIYSDRGAYRPGETAHITAVVRGADDLAPVPTKGDKAQGLPVELQLVDPREKVVKKLSLTANDAGVVTADLPFASFANTGKYRVVAVVGTAEIGRYQFNVEDFMPERMKVEAKAVKADVLSTEAAVVDVSASYLFGGSAGGSRVELTCELWPGEFKPKENANFTFGVWYPDREAPKALPLGSVSGKLSEDGKAQLTCPTPEQGGGFAGPARLVARAAVFEGESGRSTQNDVQIPVHPDTVYVGLSSGQDKIGHGDTLTYEGILVDLAGKTQKINDKVQVELVRLEAEYDWSWDEGEGDSNYRRFLRQASEGASEVAVKDGKFSGQFKIAEPASGYLVRVSYKKARTDLSIKGEDNDYFWYPSETARDQTPRPFKPGWVDIKTEDRVKTGDKVKVSFNAPFRGRVLITAETDEIIASEWRDVQAGLVEWSFPLDSFRPNVYVSVFVAKDPHLESAKSFMPDRAFGVRSVGVDPADFRHDLTIKAPAEMRPNAPLTVDVDLGSAVSGNAYVSIAAVDEGILSLTRFKSPDPLKVLFGPRALGIETFETIGWNVMLPGSGPASSSGGDGFGDDKPVQLVKPVALWSGLVKVGADGKAKVTFEVPQYRGQLRVMAVSIDKQRVGSASTSVTVRDPLVLQTTLPRFLTEGDDFNIPVSVTNMSGKEQKVKVEVAVAPIGDTEPQPIVFQGNHEVVVPLAVGQMQTVVFRAHTAAPIGGIAVAVKATAGDLISHEDLEVPIESALPKSRIVKRLEVASGETNVLPELVGWVPTTEKTSLWVTANPYADAMGHLKYLVEYPHGCIEQTTSTTRPLLVIRDLMEQVDPVAFSSTLIDDMIKKGLERVLSMQTPGGGFGYWPGDDHAVPWGTAYATHLLLDAQKLKYPVPKERVDEALEYLNSQLVNTVRYLSDTSPDDAYDLRGSAAYMHYVLALAGKGLKADMQKLLDELIAKKGNAEQVYLLKAGLWQAGDRRYEGELKLPDISPIADTRTNSWTFYSDLRRRGMTLSVFTELFGADPAGEKLANIVAERLREKQSRWYNTQELVWSVTGLGRYVQGGAKGFDADLLVGGKPLPAGSTSKTGDKSWTVVRASEKPALAVKVAKKDQGKVYLMLSSEGIRQQPDFKMGGQGLAITRNYRKADGTPLDAEAEVTLGEVIFTELTIKNVSASTIQNVALVDRFPASWEVENPRLGRGATASFIDQENLWELAYMNVRDDRMEVFGTLKAQELKKVYYASRAVVAGRFTIPPVEAEAMYDPTVWAREPGGKTNVKGPWKEFAGP